ncbi:hypothetical protein GLOTRDRAFT_121095 [Gloeophyllum trabeum ATCC 11539]|uniref:RRM domain-containing protein n=1 Tax=Gloeophyllum trabeum (strain ATCC 11539 / FP-39264 / Madison 617) TaxID=670483 RepID=S7QBM3_GLOTA|nr:uncharacterized protein GLOTRDRAFT_121095 [Gloeophyllum trabeum ATCC 11539]EPQ56752.1 hypothetical protein GLOTRDRAFT_121095 [Gloeophyllum trabeum ATCC 11539]
MPSSSQSTDPPLISKRLHISGVTPAITPADLKARLEAFGITATAIEGFDKLDGVGRPRGFGYVDVVGREDGVKRCMTALSGATWKGAKLRLGEAKPDFRERLERERAAPPPARPPKRPRGVHGVHAPSMDPVSPEEAKSKKVFRVTETGRVVTLVRMRPEKPLGVPEDVGAKGKGKEKKEKERKAKKRDPPTRARRRTIDPVRYGSVHLKGAWMGEGGVRGVAAGDLAMEGLEAGNVSEEGDSDSDSESKSEEEAEDGEASRSHRVDEERRDGESEGKPAQVKSPAVLPPRTVSPGPPESDEIAQEKARSLGILQALFGDGEEWGGRESVSDVEMEAGAGEAVDKEDEDVSMKGDDEEEGSNHEGDAGMDPAPHTEDGAGKGQADDRRTAEDSGKEKSQTKLKDLFAPREEEVGFSLLGHLVIDDLELDEDLALPSITDVAPAAPSAPQPTAIVLPSSHAPKKSQPVTLDPKAPLFFPRTKGRGKDALDVFRERGWVYEPLGEEELKKLWEEGKGEMTRDWKRRRREAGKSADAVRGYFCLSQVRQEYQTSGYQDRGVVWVRSNIVGNLRHGKAVNSQRKESDGYAPPVLRTY